MIFRQPISFYSDGSNCPLIFHLIHVGEGLMILIIFPDNTTLLFDCNVIQENKDEVLHYLKTQIPYRKDDVSFEEVQWIDIFVNSHRDIDHLRGLKEINNEFEIKSIWDSGQTGNATEDDDYLYYMNLRRTISDKYGESAVLVPIPSPFPLRSFGGASVFCLCSSLDFISKDIGYFFQNLSTIKAAKDQHSNSIVLSIEYSGRRVLLTGDSDWYAWKEKIIPNYESTDLLSSEVLIASHHGSRSFFTDESINDHIDIESNPDTTYLEALDFIKPVVTLIPCGKYKTAHHPNEEALELYKKNTTNEQVYTTHEKKTLVGIIDALGHWTVCPSRFQVESNCSKSFTIHCVEVEKDNSSKRVQKNSGDSFTIGNSVEFSIIAKGGVMDPSSKLKIWWEVSNGVTSHFLLRKTRFTRLSVRTEQEKRHCSM